MATAQSSTPNRHRFWCSGTQKASRMLHFCLHDGRGFLALFVSGNIFLNREKELGAKNGRLQSVPSVELPLCITRLKVMGDQLCSRQSPNLFSELSIQYLPDLAPERLQREGFLYEVHAAIQDSMVIDGIFCISRHIKHLDFCND